MLYLVSCFSCLWKAFYVPLSQEAKKKANILLEIAYARACQLFFMFMESFLCHIVSNNNCLAIRKNGTAVLRTVYFLSSECVNTSHGRTVVIPSIHISSLL
jgi:hypothetical protein